MPRPLYLSGLVALTGVSLLAIGLSVACGESNADGNDVAPASATSTTAAATTTPQPSGTSATSPTASGGSSADSPVLEPPVSQYSILVQDLGIQNFLTDLEGTWKLTTESYGGSSAFESAEEGIKNLTSWGYIEGYKTALIPEGGAQALLNGGYVVHHELHMFTSSGGAEDAFDYFRDTVSSNGISNPVETETVGNESFVSRTLAGKVGASNIDQVLHQVIFQRGNIVAVVLTIGAEPLMQVETVLELGTIIDDKIMDQREHPEPTPIPTRTTTPEATAQR